MATVGSESLCCSSSLSETEVNILYKSLQLSVDYIWKSLRLELQQRQLDAIMLEHFSISTPTSVLGNKLCCLASEMEARLSKGSKDTFVAKHFGDVSLTSSTASSFFKDCAERILDEDISWGRIVGLFFLSGILAYHFITNETVHTPLLKAIPLWIPSFIADHRSIITWIKENGGWDRLLDLDVSSTRSNAIEVITRIVPYVSQFLLNPRTIFQPSFPERSSEKVPPNILDHGVIAQRAYERAWKDGEVHNSIVPIVLVGQSRSGKTSLLRSLHGEKFNPSEDSTIGAKIQQSLSKVVNGDWEKYEPDEQIIYNQSAAKEMVKYLFSDPVNLIKDGLNDEVDGTFSTTQNSLNRITSEINNVNMMAGLEDEFHEWTAISSNICTQSNTLPKDVTTCAVNMLENSNYSKQLDSYQYLHTMDFAGQPVYSVTHPVFLPPKGIFLLVHNLENSLHAQATPMVRHGAAEKALDDHCPMTNMDHLEFWLSLIVANSTADSCCSVFIVCTHADKVSLEDATQIARRILDILTRDNFAPGHQVVRGIYLVNNAVSGNGGPEDPGVQLLKLEISKKVKDLPLSKNVQLRWFLFVKKISDLACQRRKKFISFEKAKTIAMECTVDVDSDEFCNLLEYLHDLKIIIYFPETNMIIIDTQWLLDMFSKVITVPPIECHEEYEQEWRKLEKQGIVEVKFLEHLWSEFVGDHTPMQTIITIMEKFSLICRQQDGSFLVPAMLLSAPECNELIQKDSIVSPLVIQFRSSHLPFGLFPRLFVAVHQMCDFKWPHTAPPYISRNFARFYIADDTFSLVLTSGVQTITVALIKEESPVSQDDFFVQLCTFLMDFLKETLQKFMESFPWMKTLEFEFGICCPICQDAPCTKHNKTACIRDSCIHFIPEKELLKKTKPRCHENPTKPNVIPTSTFSHWFQIKDNNYAKENETQDTLHMAESFQELCLTSSSTEDDVCKEVIAAVNQMSKMTSWEVTRVAKEIADVFNLDKHSMANPPKEITQKCRRSCRRLIAKGGMDFVEALQKELPSGMTGPLRVGYDVKVRDMDSVTITQLSQALSGQEMEWKAFAKEKVGLTADQVNFLDKRKDNPVLVILNEHCRDWSVEELYDAIVESGADAIADRYL